MAYKVVYLDGAHSMLLIFSDEKVGRAWLGLVHAIKQQAEEVEGYIAASGRQYVRMSDDQKSVGENWLEKVAKLRAFGYEVPPSIDTAENNYQAIKRGKEI